jgi:arylsulfatase A-like enzyme
MKKYSLIVLIFLLNGVVWAGNKKNGHRKPNILIIQPDQHRGDYLGCAGHPTVQTPNLDKLAAEGIRFSKAASASPVCCPFRATMQTGLYIHEHGVVDNGITLDYDFKGIAEFFVEKGYATGYIGKWHLGGFLPENPPGGYIEEGEPRFGWQEWQGYEKAHEFFEVWKFNKNKEKVRVEGYDWEPTWHTDMALDFIERKTKENQPWCYYIAYGPPHNPEQCPEEFLNRYDPDDFELTPDAQQLSPEKQAKIRKILQVYHGQVTAIDHEIGRIEKRLMELGVDDNTIIIYTSDHGDVLGSHNEEIVKKYINDKRNLGNTLRTKGKPFSMAFRIPFIVKGPGVKKQGMVCDALLNSVDMVPTILSLAGIEVPDYMPGKDMSDWYRKGKGPDQKYIYLGLRDVKNAWRAVWDGEYFLSELAYRNLYNTEEDPMELNNLYDNPNYAKKQKELMSALLKMAKSTGDPVHEKLLQSNEQ